MGIFSRIQKTIALGEVTNLIRNLRYYSGPFTTTTRPWKDIPGPSSLPIIGCALHFLPKIGFLSKNLGYEFSDKLYKMYGPIVKIEGFLTTPNTVFLYDPDAIATVLQGEDKLPIRPGFLSVDYYRKVHRKKMHKSVDPIYKGTTGLVHEHGETWKQMREIVDPILMKPTTIQLYSSDIDKVAMDMVHRIRRLRDTKNMITKGFDLEMSKWALESIGVIALGRRIGCLDSDLSEDSPATQLIKTVHDMHNIGQHLHFKPSLWRYFSTPTFKKAMEIYDKQMSLNAYFLNEAKKDIQMKKEKSKDNDDQGTKSVLEKLLDSGDNIAEIMASDLLFAGVDTVSNTMLSTLYFLATNDDQQEKLRTEVQLDLTSRPYLRACIKESIRLMPAVSGNVRLTTKHYNLCGYRVPKNTTIVLGQEYVAKMESQYPWSKDYLPERWLVDKNHPVYYRNAHKFAYTPFGYGVRQCVGKRIAYLESEALTTKIVQNYKLRWDGPPPVINPTSLNYFSGPFNLVFDDWKKKQTIYSI